MKYGIVFRKIELNNKIIYQGVKKIKGNINENSEIQEIDENNKVISTYPELFSDNDIKNYVFFEISEESFESIPDDLRNSNLFLINDEGTLKQIGIPHEKEKIKLAFYNAYHDFDIVPKYDLNLEIENVRNALKEKVKGQDEVIENILSKIYNNQLFISSDLSHQEMSDFKTNILVMGPHGTGKSLIKNILVKEFTNIPIIEYELTGNLTKDVNNIMNELLSEAKGNVTLAERGIVIFDSMKETSKYFSDDGENLYLEEIRSILENNYFYNSETDEKIFNYSTVTNIVMFDIALKENESKSYNTFYSKADIESLMEFGFDQHIIYDLFNEEIVYMNEMTYDLALEILKDKKISPLYKIRNVFKKNNKTLKFSRGFVNKLIEHGLKLEEGFQGIIRILNYLIQKKGMQGDVIEFNVKDLDELSVGTANFDELLDEYDENSDSYNPNSTNLKVNVKNRTINGLKVSDAVKIITNKIKGQDEQVFRIVNSLYNQIMNRYKHFNKEQTRELKSSVLLIGSPGTGKTAILEKLATIFNIPYVREDATRFSGTGIVGADVDDMLKDLVDAAHGDRNLAQTGILFLDEFDKLAANHGNKVDIGGDVQRALLTVLEGANVQIRPSQREQFQPYEFDTTYLIVFAGGAFDGIDEIVKKRVKKERKSQIGFSSDNQQEINKKITSEDISEYGIDKQVSRRLPNIIHLNNLDEDILLEIINSKEGYVNLSRKSMEFEGIKLNISEGFKQSLAHKSFLDKKGASSIKTVFSKLLDEIDMKRANEDIEEVVLDENSLDYPENISYGKRKIKK